MVRESREETASKFATVSPATYAGLFAARQKIKHPTAHLTRVYSLGRGAKAVGFDMCSRYSHTCMILYVQWDSLSFGA